MPGAAERISSPTAAVNRCSALQISVDVVEEAVNHRGGRRFAWSDWFGPPISSESVIAQ